MTHYQDTAGNNVMMAEKKGDKVQVCFLGPPAPTQYCDPDKDPRGGPTASTTTGRSSSTAASTANIAAAAPELTGTMLAAW